MHNGRRSGALSHVEQALLVVVLAGSLFLRLDALDVFITVDEPNWASRSQRFYAALRGREFEGTYQTEHPGVVTMWSGAFALRILNAMGGSGSGGAAGTLVSRGESSATEGVAPLTQVARLIVASVTWLGIVGMHLLCRRLFGRRIALIATILVAFDPFYLSHSRLHHLDALLTTFAMLSVLSFLVYQFRARRRVYLVLSAACAGLAIANKSPGLYLVPCVLLTLGIGAWSGGAARRPARLARAAGDMVVWLVAAGGVLVVVWPAMWVDPLGTLDKVVAGGFTQAFRPHEHGNFFWLRARPDPGPGFYPVAWAFRTSPWAMAGLVALVVWRRRRAVDPPVVLLLALALGYGTLLSLSAKKFDRYILPALPLLDIAAAVGWCGLASHLLTRRRIALPRLILSLFAAAVALSQFAMAWAARPYYLAYYNPLVGGARSASRILLYGWGEGLEKAASYLNSKPNAGDLHVASHSPDEFAAFFVGRTTLMGSRPLLEPDYFVLYSSHVQRKFVRAVIEHLRGVRQPEYVVRSNGLDYAWVYPNTIHLAEGTDALQQIESLAQADEEAVILSVDAALARSYRGGLPLRTIAEPTREDFVLNGLDRATEGLNRVWFLTFPHTGEETNGLISQHLEAQGSRLDEIVAGDVRAVRYQLDDDACFASCDPVVGQEYRVGDRIRLVGYDLSESDLTPATVLHLRLHWVSEGPTEKSYTTFVHLVGPDGGMYGQDDSLPQGGAWPTTGWLASETVVADHVIQIAPEAPPGDYTLYVGMYDLDTMERLPVLDEMGLRLPDDRIPIEGLRLGPGG